MSEFYCAQCNKLKMVGDHIFWVCAWEKDNRVLCPVCIIPFNSTTGISEQNLFFGFINGNNTPIECFQVSKGDLLGTDNVALGSCAEKEKDE